MNMAVEPPRSARCPENYPSGTVRVDAMKPKGEKKLMAYEERRDLSAKRVIAAICQWVDKLGYKFRDDRPKLMYVKGIACRAAQYAASTRQYRTTNGNHLHLYYGLQARHKGNPELNHPVGKN